METKIHRFERAGLGKAPFRCVAFYVSKFQACPGAPILPGASCDFCGTAIMQVYVVESSDGKRSKVGCDCIRKVGDRGLVRETNQAAAQHRRELFETRTKTLVTEATAALARAEVRAVLAAKPDPTGRPEPRNLLNYVEWCLKHAGSTGKSRVARIVLKAAA